MLTTRNKPSTSSVEGGIKAGAVRRPIIAGRIASPPVCTDACIETANDVVQANFKFIVVRFWYTLSTKVYLP